MNTKVLVINPGSTSTKVAMCENGAPLWEENISHSREELAQYPGIPGQKGMRFEAVIRAVEAHGETLDDLAAVATRGGMFARLKSGAYQVNEAMLERAGHSLGQHASNLGAGIAWQIARPRGIKAYIYDAVTADEMIPLVRITGLKGMERRGQGHNLNMRAAALRLCREKGIDYYRSSLLVSHLGGGITHSLHQNGRIIDMISDHEGSFSPERAGALPGFDLIRLCYSGKYTLEQMLELVQRKGGLVSHLGTSDSRQAEKMIDEGNGEAALIYEAMALNVAKQLARLAVVVDGKVDYIVLTGGIAYSRRFTAMVKKRVEFLAPVEILPGENEMQALYEGTMRVLRGEEAPHLFEA